MGKAMLEIVDLHKSFNGRQVLRGVNLKAEKGMTTVIIGRSGEGKSVLLKHIIGLLRPDRGQVRVEGIDVTQLKEFHLNEIRKKKFGMCFQEAALFDSMTIYDNVAFPLREHTRLKETQVHKIVWEKLRQVGVEEEAHKFPAEVSGGIRKRAGLARAIALDPQIVLFDEPTTGLDPVLTDSINQMIRDTHDRLGITCIVISHDILGAFEIGHKVAMLYEGRILEEGTPQQIRNTTNPVVRQFITGSLEGPIQIL